MTAPASLACSACASVGRRVPATHCDGLGRAYTWCATHADPIDPPLRPLGELDARAAHDMTRRACWPELDAGVGVEER